MTKDEIISMARKAGGSVYGSPRSPKTVIDVMFTPETIERFTSLVATAEREACADILDRNCDKCDPHSIAYEVLDSNAKAIRARGQQ